MDKFAVETLLYSADYGDDDYLLASSSSSESDDECHCFDTPKTDYLKSTVPQLSELEFKRDFRVTRKIAEKVSEIIGDESYTGQKTSISKGAYVFLWYLGNVDTLDEISDRFNINTTCVEAIIKLGAERVSARSSEFIFWPPRSEYAKLAGLYREVADVKGTLGSMGVFDFDIPNREPNHDSEEKDKLSVLGTVTPNLKFIDISVYPRGGSYEDILEGSDIADKADEGLLEGYTLICDSSFPQRPWLRPPHPKHQSKLNKHHGVAMSILLMSVRHLKEKFRRLQRLEDPRTVFLSNLVRSACVIHNMCVDEANMPSLPVEYSYKLTE